MLMLLPEPETLWREFQECAPGTNGTWAGWDTHVSWCEAMVLPAVELPDRSIRRRPETNFDDPATKPLLRVLPGGLRW